MINTPDIKENAVEAEHRIIAVAGHEMRCPVPSTEIHGRLASHTGYRSFSGKHMSYDELVAHCEQQASYAYLVWEEHKEYGWKEIGRWYLDDTLYVRIPKWASATIKEALEKIGMFCIDDLNNFWSFEDATIQEAEIREILAPLRKPGTRAVDEAELATALTAKFRQTDAFMRTNQLSLF